MPVSFSPGISVEYAGARWRVLRAESVLLGSDAGEEVAADPLKIRLSDGGSLLDRRLDERRYSDPDWSEVERRRDVLLALALDRNSPTERFERGSGRSLLMAEPF